MRWCVVTLFLLFSSSSSSSSSSVRRLEWDVNAVDPADRLTHLTSLAPHSDYLLHIQIRRLDTKQVDTSTTRELSDILPRPQIGVRFGGSLATGSLNRTWEQYHTPGGGWWVPFSTSDAGFISLVILQRKAGVFDRIIRDTYVFLNVDCAVIKNGTEHTKALGEVLDPPTLPGAGVVETITPSPYEGLLPSTLIVVNSQIPALLYSTTAFIHSSLLHVAAEAFPATSVCGDGIPSSALLQATPLASGRTLLVTGGGVVVLDCGIDDSPPTFRLVLDECITGLFGISQFADVFESLVDTVHVTTMNNETGPRVFVSVASRIEFTEVVDHHGVPLYDAFGGELELTSQILSCAISTMHPSAHLFLLDSGDESGTRGRYSVRSLDHGVWKTVFLFPYRLPQNVRTLLHTCGEEGEVLSLRGMELSKTLGCDLFAWGNALLYSPDCGVSFYVIANIRITEFASAGDGSYAVLTEENGILYGQISTLELVTILHPRPNDGRLHHIFFDTTDKLIEITIPVAATTVEVTRTELDVQTLLDLELSLLEKQCPYTQLTVNASHDVHYTRTVDTTREYPSILYLNQGEAYSLSLSVVPAAWCLATDMHLKYELSPPDYVGMRLVSPEISTTATFEVTVWDREWSRPSSHPGENMTVSSLRLILDGSTLACNGPTRSNGLKASYARSITIMTGCPPGRHLAYDRVQSRGSEGCDDTDEYVCLFYDNTYRPVFTIIDGVAESGTVRFEGRYSFRIVGAGSTVDGIWSFTEEEVERYNNGGNQPIWTASSEKGHNTWLPPHAEINWICSPGSPCAAPLPRFPDTPCAFLWVRVTTGDVGNPSYCNYTTEFVIRLHGIPMDLFQTATIVFTTLGMLFAILAVWYWMDPRRRQEEGEGATTTTTTTTTTTAAAAAGTSATSHVHTD